MTHYCVNGLFEKALETHAFGTKTMIEEHLIIRESLMPFKQYYEIMSAGSVNRYPERGFQFIVYNVIIMYLKKIIRATMTINRKTS